MAVINFPDSPSDGATQTVGGITYTYSSSKGYWTAAASGGGGGGGASVTTDDTAPSSPSDGDLGINTDDGGMFVYYADTDSSQWVEVIGSQGATGATGATGAAGADGGAGVASVYATIDLLPLSDNTQGDMAHVTANNTLYFWNGSGWYKIALINTNPSISGVASSYTLATDGTATTVTITASDPEGIPITYSIASDTSGNIATVAQGTGASTNVFTITPSTNTAYAGSFSLTFRASDGVNIATAPATFTLQFSVQNSNYTTALITTAGSAGTNSTFTDSSSNSQSLTVYGDTTQTSFSPYRSGGYSLYCNGSGGDYIKTDTSADFAFGSSDFTVECWYYPVSKAQNYPRILDFGTYWSGNDAWGLLDRHNSINTKFTVQSFALGTILESTTTVSNNQWYHLAIERSGTTVTLYVNGVAEDTYNISTNSFPAGGITSSYLNLLNVSNGSNLGEAQANGYLRDVRVVNGSAVYTSAFTPTEEPLAAVSNTKFLMGSIPYLFDSSTSAHTFTQTTGGDYSTQPFGPYDYQEYAVGDHGGSTYFDGNGDYIQVGTNVLPAAYDTDWTVEFWMYPSTMADRGDILSQYTGGTVGRMAINTQTDNTIKFFQNGLSPAPLSSSANIYPNQWYHVAVVNSSGTRTLYVNGKSQGTATGTSSMDTTNTQIGQTPTQDNFEGNISDLRVVNGTAVYTADFTPPTAPLSAVTNTNLLINGQGAKILDKSQSTESLTLVGNTTASTAQYKYLPTSMYFDGTGDVLYTESNVLNNFGTRDFTLEAWIYPTAYTSSGWNTLFAIGNSTNNGGLLIGKNTSEEFVIRQYGTADRVSYSTLPSLNTWTHIACVRSNGTSTIYYDGVAVASASDTTSYSSTTPFAHVGNSDHTTYSHYWSGYVEDLRFTPGLARYTANFTPPTAALQG